MAKSREMELVSVILVTKRVQPPTREALKNAEDGDIIEVLPEELDQLQPVLFYRPVLEEALGGMSPSPNNSRTGKVAGRKSAKKGSQKKDAGTSGPADPSTPPSSDDSKTEEEPLV